MRVVCSYCRGAIREIEPLALDHVSHGLCEPCEQHFSRQWDGLSLDEYLDGYTCPVIVVDSDGRLLAANEAASGMLGRSPRELTGLLGGEAMECVYARLPEGCGKTVHCETCTVRQTVTATLETRVPQTRVPASIRQQGGPVALFISTRWVDGVGVVQVKIEPAG